MAENKLLEWLVQASAARLIDPSRRPRTAFPLLQVFTISGMGKTLFGRQVIANMQRRRSERAVRVWLSFIFIFLIFFCVCAVCARANNFLFSPAIVRTNCQDLSNDTALTKILETAGYVFIDFNGSGDAVDATFDRGGASGCPGLLRARLISRGLLKVDIKRARGDAAFARANLADVATDTTDVLQAIFSRQRETRRFGKDETALLVVHVDEVQLARAAIDAWRGPADGTTLLKNELLTLLQFNSQKDDERNIVLVLFTGTSDAGLTMKPTQHGITLLPLSPLSVDQSIEFIRQSWGNRHPDWLALHAFRRFVADLGGVPALLDCLANIRNIDAFYHPPQVKNVSRTDKAIQLLAGSMKIQRQITKFETSGLGVEQLAELARLSMTQIPVRTDFRLGNTDLQTLADSGFIVTTPVPADQSPIPDSTMIELSTRVVVRVPLILLNQPFQRKLNSTDFTIGHLFVVPFERSSGRTFELALVASLSARLSVFAQQVTSGVRRIDSFRLSELLGESSSQPQSRFRIPPAASCILAQDPAMFLVRSRSAGEMDQTNSPKVKKVEKPSQVNAETTCCFAPGQVVEVTELWHNRPQRLQIDLPGATFLHCDNTFAFDSRLVLEHFGTTRKTIFLFQSRDQDLIKGGSAAKFGADLLEGVKAVKASFPDFDLHVCVVSSQSLRHGEFKTIVEQQFQAAQYPAALSFYDDADLPTLMPAFWHRTRTQAELDEEAAVSKTG